jgi:putative membrane protein
VVAVTKFSHDGWPKTVYFFILLTHIPLAILVLPLLVKTVLPAIRGEYEVHRRWAKITAPVWLYVSVTGVLVYLMLYVWYPPVSA